MRPFIRPDADAVEVSEEPLEVEEGLPHVQHEVIVIGVQVARWSDSADAFLLFIELHNPIATEV